MLAAIESTEQVSQVQRTRGWTRHLRDEWYVSQLLDSEKCLVRGCGLVSSPLGELTALEAARLYAEAVAFEDGCEDALLAVAVLVGTDSQHAFFRVHCKRVYTIESSVEEIY